MRLTHAKSLMKMGAIEPYRLEWNLRITTMAQRLKAIYQNGAFVPQSPCDLPENSEVDLVIEKPHILPPWVTDPDERKRIMAELVQNMRDNPIPENAPHFTREELHERG